MSTISSRRPATNACSVNEDVFSKAFNDVPKTTINSANDVKDILDNASKVLLKSTDDWSKRNQQLKLIRSVIIFSEDVVDKEQMIAYLNKLNDALELSIKDLRSQVLREAAITCSFIMKTYGKDAQKIGSAIFDAAMSQVAVSTKVMATSGATLTSFIVKYIQTKQIFNAIVSYSTSKDKNIRKQVARLIEIVVVDWDDKTKIHFMKQICELIKAAICDADAETRTIGRTSFQKLEENNPNEADALFKTLDPKRQKTLRADDGCGSNASLNSERSIPIRSKLSFAGRSTPAANSRFLSQRSASAIDTKPISRYALDSTPKHVRPGIKSKIDTSPGGSKFSRPLGMGPRTTSNVKSGLPTSQPGSRNISPNRNSNNQIRREKSNLSSSFFNNLPKDKKEHFQKCMDTLQFQMRQPSLNGDDDFLLPKRSAPSTPKSPMDISKVDAVLNSCKSNSPVEKKEGIKKLSALIASVQLSENDVKKIGTTLIRLLMECSNTTVLETLSIFVGKYHATLGDWLKLGLFRIFNKKANELLPNMKKQISVTMNTIMESFDPGFQLKTLCIIICDPIQCMTPKTRIVLMEYTNDLLSSHMPSGYALNTPELKSAMLKLFSWFSDQRHGATFSQHIEKIICSLFTVNAADFSSLFSDFDSTYREKAYKILQSHGHQQTMDSKMEVDNNVKQNISATAAEISDYVNNGISGSQQPYNSVKGISQSEFSNNDKMENNLPLKSLNSMLNSVNDTNDRPYNSAFERLSLNSTAHLINDHNEQNNYISQCLMQMKDFKTPNDQLEGANSILGMLRDGSFTLWDQYFIQLLLAVFDILAHRETSENIKKVALRVLCKMCTAQAARLFDSTEMAIMRVLDSVVDCKDGTMTVAADDCLKALATHLPLPKVVNTARAIMSQESLDIGRSQLVLKMITRIFESFQPDELEPIIDEIAPCATMAYGSPSSAVRKSSVYCLVAMVNKVGSERMEDHLKCLTSRQMNLIKLYVARRMSSSTHSHA